MTRLINLTFSNDSCIKNASGTCGIGNTIAKGVGNEIACNEKRSRMVHYFCTGSGVRKMRKNVRGKTRNGNGVMEKQQKQLQLIVGLTKKKMKSIYVLSKLT